MTFGNNSSFLKANTKTSATVLDFAKDLLYDLKYAKDEDRGDLGIGDVRSAVLIGGRQSLLRIRFLSSSLYIRWAVSSSKKFVQ